MKNIQTYCAYIFFMSEKKPYNFLHYFYFVSTVYFRCQTGKRISKYLNKLVKLALIDYKNVIMFAHSHSYSEFLSSFSPKSVLTRPNGEKPLNRESKYSLNSH